MRESSMKASVIKASVLGIAVISIIGSSAHAGPTLYGDAVVLPANGQRGGPPGQSPLGFPSAGLTGVNIDIDLSWFQAVNTFSYDVYFGTDSTPDATEFLGNTAGLTFALDTLDWGTTYYWRIDSVGSFTVPGFVWFFTTEPQPLPDLNVTDVIFTMPGSFHPGDEFFITTVYQNDGDAPASGLYFRYYASLDNIITTDDILLSTSTSNSELASGDNGFLALGTTLFDSFPEGTYYFGVLVTDFDNLDPDLSNNAIASPTTNTVLPPRYDLRAWVCSYDASVSYNLGDTIDVTSRVLNQGDLPATNIDLEFYASTDSTITTDDLLLGNLNYFGTPINEGTTWIAENTPVLLIGDDSKDLLTPGTYYIGIYVRDGDDNLANNGLAGQFPITIIGPCLADLNGDGVLNFFDVSAFLQAFGNNDLVADFTDDGVLNFFDVSAFLGAFGAGCP